MTKLHLSLRLAEKKDFPAVFQLYRSQIGTTFCSWSESYPSMENIRSDFLAGALYLAEDDSGIPAGAGTIRPWPEHDPAAPWKSENPCDLMRICVRPERKGRGVGTELLNLLVGEAREKGFGGMRILVNETNLPAEKLYRAAGAEFRGRTFSYNVHWNCLEIVFPVQRSSSGSGRAPAV